MNCSDLKGQIDPHVDGELSLGEWFLVQEHLAGCPTCERRSRFAFGFERTLRQHLPVQAAPANLVVRVRERLAGLEDSSRWQLGRLLLHPMSGYAVAAVLLVAMVLPLAGVGLPHLLPPSASEVAEIGTVVCVECDQAHRSAEEQKQCRAFLHHTGIKTSDGRTWNLANLGAGVQLAGRLDLRGSRVRFQGTLYPEIQIVDVSDFELVQDL